MKHDSGRLLPSSVINKLIDLSDSKYRKSQTLSDLVLTFVIYDNADCDIRYAYMLDDVFYCVRLMIYVMCTLAVTFPA